MTASFAATTSPDTGAYTSEAAFTDSTTAIASPAFTLRPALGNSRKTRSPSAACAWSVMPTVNVPSDSLRIHSWLAV